jgi:hypothetical protein
MYFHQVQGYTRPREYIVTEWPLPHTLGDLWSLVYDYDCSAVVVLTSPPPSSVSFFPATLYPITSNQYTCPLEPILTLFRSISAELPGILARRPSFRQVRPRFHSRSRFPQSLPKHQKLDLSDQQKGNGTQHTFLSVSVYSLDQNVCVSCFKIKMHTHDA